MAVISLAVDYAEYLYYRDIVFTALCFAFLALIILFSVLGIFGAAQRKAGLVLAFFISHVLFTAICVAWLLYTVIVVGVNQEFFDEGVWTAYICVYSIAIAVIIIVWGYWLSVVFRFYKQLRAAEKMGRGGELQQVQVHTDASADPNASN